MPHFDRMFLFKFMSHETLFILIIVFCYFTFSQLNLLFLEYFKGVASLDEILD